MVCVCVDSLVGVDVMVEEVVISFENFFSDESGIRVGFFDWCV